MLPGFISRLHTELLRAISPPTSQQSSRPPSRPGRPRLAHYDKYACLRQLVPYFAILNNPSPPPLQPNPPRGSLNAGKAPGFTPAAMAWVGGSLAGYDTSSPGIRHFIDSINYPFRALKIGGVEVPRERWDEAEAEPEADDPSAMQVDPTTPPRPSNILPDWTRSPLPYGAPPANSAQGQHQPSVVVSAVGA